MENSMVYGTELEGGGFNKAAKLFEDLKHHLSIKGVLEGVLRGRIFLSNDGRTALLTSPQGLFLGGSPDNASFLGEISKLIPKELLAERASTGKLDYVLFYPSDNQAWEEASKRAAEDLLPMRNGRMKFTHDLEGIGLFLEDGIVPVDRSLLRRQDVPGLDGVISEILEGWPSLEAFEERGFGCAAVLHDGEGMKIIGWCLTDWVVGDECEFGIETYPEHRRQQWALRMAAGSLALAKQRGMSRAGWQCWSDNIGSQRTALAAGFKLLADFPVLFGWNHPLNNLLVNGNYYMRGNTRYDVPKDYARAAWSYAQALDQGWDWNGDAALYWNAACLFYLTGEAVRAKHYYKIAREKGWLDISQPHYHEHVYREENSGEIARILAE